MTTSSFINRLLGDVYTAHRRAYSAALLLAAVAVAFGGWEHLAAAAAGALTAIGFTLRQRALDEPVFKQILSHVAKASQEQLAEIELLTAEEDMLRAELGLPAREDTP